MKRFLILLFTFFLFGCATLPDYVQGCSDYADTDEEIKECEEKVIRREDNRAARIEQDRLDNIAAQRCWKYVGGVWDQRNRRCRTLFEIGMY